MNTFAAIRELIRINRQFGGKTGKSLFLPSKKKSQLKNLAQKYASPGSETEAHWSREFCQTDPHSHAYISLRSKLKRRLIGELFHLHIQEGSAIRKAIYRNAREVFAIRMLLMFGARPLAIWLVPRALERARTYELTQDRLELLQFLREHAALNGDKIRFLRIAREYEETLRIRSVEMKLRAFLDEIEVELIGRAKPNEKAKALAASASKEARDLYELYPTFNIGFQYYRLAAIDSESKEDSRRTFHLCDRAEQLFQAYPALISPVYRGLFAIKRLSTSIGIHEFNGARQALETCQLVFPSGSNNWFIWKENECFLLLHTARFAEAETLRQQITKHERFLSQPEQVQQLWAIYAHFIALGQSRAGSKPVPKKAFERILKEVPVYSKDKAGYNAALLHLQLLLLASRKDLFGMLGKSEAIRTYISRYLRNRRHSQHYAFFKTFLFLFQSDFDIRETHRRAAKYIAQFQRYGIDEVNAAQTYPFDRSWEWIVEWLEGDALWPMSKARKSVKNEGLKSLSAKSRIAILKKM